jgi:hypothetical protein
MQSQIPIYSPPQPFLLPAQPPKNSKNLFLPSATAPPPLPPVSRLLSLIHPFSLLSTLRLLKSLLYFFNQSRSSFASLLNFTLVDVLGRSSHPLRLFVVDFDTLLAFIRDQEEKRWSIIVILARSRHRHFTRRAYHILLPLFSTLATLLPALRVCLPNLLLWHYPISSIPLPDS